MLRELVNLLLMVRSKSGAGRSMRAAACLVWYSVLPEYWKPAPSFESSPCCAGSGSRSLQPPEAIHVRFLSTFAIALLGPFCWTCCKSGIVCLLTELTLVYFLASNVQSNSPISLFSSCPLIVTVLFRVALHALFIVNCLILLRYCHRHLVFCYKLQ